MDSQQSFYRCFGKYKRRLTNRWAKTKSLRQETERYHILVDEIKQKYDSGEGFKFLANDYNTTYSKMRSFCRTNFKCREGHNVITDKLREKRKQKALKEHQQQTGWFSPEIRRKTELNTRGVQYWYESTRLNKNVWLRSTWEYIFAKWLNKTNHIWDVEVTQYKMKDGRQYRPDFFILNENHDIIKIIEIKGYWDNNSDKALQLNNELDIDVSIITDIKPFIDNNTNYHKELYLWKQIKELKIYG